MFYVLCKGLGGVRNGEGEVMGRVGEGKGWKRNGKEKEMVKEEWEGRG